MDAVIRSVATQAMRAYQDGMTFELQGKYRRALQAYRAAAAIAPEEPRFALAIARIYGRLGNAGQAAHWYLRSLSEEDDALPAVHGLVDPEADLVAAHTWLERLQPLRMAQPEMQAAIDHLVHLLVRFGPDEAACRKLACLLSRLGRVAEAAHFFVEANMAQVEHAAWPTPPATGQRGQPAGSNVTRSQPAH